MTSETLPAGTVIGDRFEIRNLLGVGGLGDLYRANDLKSGKDVALRVFASDLVRSEAVMDQLREQVKNASALSHKNIARVYGMGKESSLRYLAMELVDGQNLRKLLERKRQSGRTFSLKGAYNVLAHACNALHHAHKTMYHGLPGPGSILINRAGRIKLVDFGIVQALAPGSSTVARLGDFYSLAPEMHTDPHAAGPAADIYTIGVVLHELLTGQPPSDPPEPMSNLVGGLPPAVESVVSRCLEIEPSRRYPDLQQLKAAFYAAIEDQGSSGVADGIADTGAQPALNIPMADSHHQPAPASLPRHVTTAPGPAVAPVAVPAAMNQSAPQGVQASQPIAASSSHPLAAQPAKEVNIEDLLADTDMDERWLIQKDRLDFGPFTSGALKRALYKTEFSGEDILVDQETGQRMPVRQHAAFQEFMRHLDRHLAVHRAKAVEAEQKAVDRKRRTVLVTMLVIGIVFLTAGGVVAAYMLTKDPEIREKVVYREKTKMAGLKVQVEWKAEPKDQASKRRSWRKRRRRAGKPVDDVLNLGDASRDGGDALLSQKVIQGVMAKAGNFQKLARCVHAEIRRNPGLRRVGIDFNILGSGKVSFVKVNGKTGGPLTSCMRQKMRTIRFPKFDGVMTRASFTMRLQ